MADTKSRRKPRVEVAVQEARANLKELLNRAEFYGERIVITRYDKGAAALVSIADLEKIEAASTQGTGPGEAERLRNAL